MRNCDRQTLRGFVRCAADSRDRVHQGKLRDRESPGEPEHRERPVPNQCEVGAHAHRDEEKPEEQTLEGLDIRFQLVAKLGIGKQHSGEECAERSGQADLLHDECGPYHEQQRRRGKYFAPAIACDGLEHGTNHEAACRDDYGDDPQGFRR